MESDRIRLHAKKDDRHHFGRLVERRRHVVLVLFESNERSAEVDLTIEAGDGLSRQRNERTGWRLHEFVSDLYARERQSSALGGMSRSASATADSRLMTALLRVDATIERHVDRSVFMEFDEP